MFRFTLSRPTPAINSIPSWVDIETGINTWSLDINFHQKVVLGSFQGSSLLVDNIVNPYLGVYTFLISADGSVNGGAGNTAQLTFHFLDEEQNIIHSSDPITIPNAGITDYELSFETDGVKPFYIAVDANNLTSSSNTVTISAIAYDGPVSELEISEPDGWKGAKIKLERDLNFFSLIEYYEGAANGAFIFYGDNGTENGGIDFIRQVEKADGFDAELNILIEHTTDGVTYSTLFSGQLDISQKTEMPNNRMQVPIIRDDFWSKFIARMDTPVKVTENIDLDGNVVEAVTPVTVNLISQKIEKVYSGRYQYAYDLGQPENQGYEYYQPDFETETLNEIKGKITLPRMLVNQVESIFQMEEDGEYTFDIKLTLGHNAPIDPNFCQSTLGKYIPYIQFNNDAPIAFTGTDVTHGSDVVTEWLYNDTIALNRLDTVKIYVQDHFDFSTDVLFIFGDEGFEFSGAFQYGESYMEVTGQTTYPETQAQGYLIHDLFHAIAARMGLGTDPVYSEFLGGLNTNARSYDENGCGWMYAVLKGIHIRGYSLTDEDDDPVMRYTLQQKGFSMSFKELWSGINPVLNLGLGYEQIEGRQVLRIEQKRHFIGDTPPVNFSNVRDITSEYDSDFIFKTIKTGYKKWQSEEIAGIDDPQTKHTRATIIVKSGRELDLESGFIAASLAIETTRRTKITKSADYKFDNDNFIISLNTDDVSPDVYAPELDENFPVVENLKNSQARYNLNLTPLRNLIRWGNYWAGCLQSYLGSSLKFVSGEGNYDMTSTADFEACRQGIINESLSEGQDIAISQYHSDFGYFFLPMIYSINIPMDKDDFNLIDRKEPIGISQSDSSHADFHIKELTYDVVKGTASIKAWPKLFFDITVPEQEITSPTCE